MIMSHAARADAAEGHVILRYMKDRFVNRHAARHHARNIEIARLRCGCQKADMNEYRNVESSLGRSTSAFIISQVGRKKMSKKGAGLKRAISSLRAGKDIPELVRTPRSPW